MEEAVRMIAENGMETVLIALAVNLMTSLIKRPLKKLAERLKDSGRATRYIVFLPIVIGFALTALYAQFFGGGFAFVQSFIAQWVTASSLSLTFYAVFEKLFPKKEKAFTAEEIAANTKLLAEIQAAAKAAKAQQESAPREQSGAAEQTKIILRGKRDEGTQTEEKPV